MRIINSGDIMETIEMLTEENLDVRTVTMGISLLDCIDPDADKACEKIYNKIVRLAGNLVPVVDGISAEYGIPIVNKRISVTPIAMLLGAAPEAAPGQYAKTLGHKKALCLADNACCMDKERMDGFRAAFAPGEALFWQIPALQKERTRFYEEHFSDFIKLRCTVVFAVSDYYALEFMRFLQVKGVRIPEDVQIIGFDDIAASRESIPALTTIHQDAAQRAKTAIACLEAMRSGSACDTRVVLPVSLICRESTRELPCQTL